MTNTFYKFPSLQNEKQFRKNIKPKNIIFRGLDEDGQPILEPSKVGKIQLKGTVKVHGTNAAIVIDHDNGTYYTQSRNRIITPDDDNCGFANAMLEIKDGLVRFAKDYCSAGKTIFYGEWVGGNVQRGVALTGAPKKFVIFKVAIVTSRGEFYFTGGSYHRDYLSNALITYANSPVLDKITNFTKYTYTLDFESPESWEGLRKLTTEVEEHCPVGCSINPDRTNNIGEGIVWCIDDPDLCNDPSLWVKIKGDKHKRVAPKVPKTVTEVELTAEQMVVFCYFKMTALTGDRLMQGIEYLKEMNLEIELQSTPVFMKWFVNDVYKECISEHDACVNTGLTKGFVRKAVNNYALDFFKDYVEKIESGDNL